MLKVLIKKQMMELLKGFLINQKKNTKRTKGQTIAFSLFYILLVFGFLGGFFAFFAYSMCDVLFMAGLGWMYFPFFGLFTILMGFICCVFTTPGMIYRAKDNDTLLSLPITYRDIIISRFSGLYIMCAVFSLPVYIPAIIVYYTVCSFTLGALIGQIVGFLFVTALALLLCSLVGMVIAKLSTKIKSKSFISLIAAALFLVVYFYFVDAIQGFMDDVAAGAIALANTLNGFSSVFKNFGEMCLGAPIGIIIFFAAALVMLGLCIYLTSIGFFKIATASAVPKKVSSKVKRDKAKSLDLAILGKEAGRLVASSNYMLNCCLGAIFIPAGGIVLLIKAGALTETMDDIGMNDLGFLTLLFTAMICLISSMIDTAAPSVSLEGKAHWISQTLPVDPWVLLKGKLNLELSISMSTTLFAQICALIALKPDIVNGLLLLILPQAYIVLSGLVNTCLSVHYANYDWTSEIFPIKQSGGVVIGIFSGWIYAAIMVALFFIFRIENEELYLCIWAVATAAFCYVLYKYLKGPGAVKYIQS